jgi:phosphoglycolate phosphatase
VSRIVGHFVADTDAMQDGSYRRLPAPRAVLYDWDNTLVDNWHTIHRANNAALAAMGHPTWTFEETLARVKASMRDTYPAMFGDRWPEAQKVFYDTFAQRHLEDLRPLPGAAALLADCAAREIYQCVVSNKNGRYLRAEATHLGWDRFFGRVVGATDAVRDKPDVAPVDMALADSGIARGPEVWFVGDSAIDMLCAHNAGLTPVLVHSTPPDAASFAEVMPAAWFANCDALVAMLASQ